MLYQLNLIQVQSENLAKVESHGGVFVPGRGKVSITPQAAALAPMAGGVVTQTGNGATLIYDNPPMWSVQRFFASDYLELPGDFSVAAKMEEYKTNSLAVEVLNDSNQPLFDSYLRLSNVYQVGPLELESAKQLPLPPCLTLTLAASSSAIPVPPPGSTSKNCCPTPPSSSWVLATPASFPPPGRKRWWPWICGFSTCQCPILTSVRRLSTSLGES